VRATCQSIAENDRAFWNQVMAVMSGLYGVFRLDGGPCDARDVKVLGLQLSSAPGLAHAQAIDEQMPKAVHGIEGDGALTLLLGFLEDAEILAARLNMAKATPHAQLARAALARFGADLPAEMMGEWSLLHWEPTGRLTLMLSAARRDRLFFAISDNKVAIAPDLFLLGRIPWVGSTLNETGFLLALGRSGIRAHLDDRTMLANVRQLRPGASLTLTRDQHRFENAKIFTPVPKFEGTFEEAVVESEVLLRRIVKARMARTAAPAILLSGGLDSSLLAWLASEERQIDQRVRSITSVAPPESKLGDERQAADAVINRLGLVAEYAWPPAAANIYRPPDFLFAGAGGPLLHAHHALAESFQATARKQGASLLLEGSYGELTITGRLGDVTPRQRLKAFAKTLLTPFMSTHAREPEVGPFHARLSSHRLASLPEEVRAAIATPKELSLVPRLGEQLGYLQSAAKSMSPYGEPYAGAIRTEIPFRDLRLLRLFAGFPAKFLLRDGYERAPARYLLAGKLPDSVRLRTMHGPASPDYMAQIKRQAPQARTRLAAFRAADIDEWLDLEWLDGALARIGEHGPRDITDAFEVQFTAHMAEFLCWWRVRS
jgi:asparagine synthase (glutamine-hydrolysing)